MFPVFLIVPRVFWFVPSFYIILVFSFVLVFVFALLWPRFWIVNLTFARAHQSSLIQSSIIQKIKRDAWERESVCVHAHVFTVFYTSVHWVCYCTCTLDLLPSSLLFPISQNSPLIGCVGSSRWTGIGSSGYSVVVSSGGKTVRRSDQMLIDTKWFIHWHK